MKTLTFYVLITLSAIACGNDPQPEVKSTASAPAPQKAILQTSSQNPCELIAIDELAAVLALDPGKITPTKSTGSDNICVFATTELSEEEESVDFLYVDVRYNKNGSDDLELLINSRIEQGSMAVPAGPNKGKMIPTREVKEVGDKAVIYSASYFTTLIFHKENKVRYALTFYRDVPKSFIFDGLALTSEELEVKLIEFAKTL
ncbi:MAG: hypothetical protein AAGI38_15915 [Bacteroidota bacterium]